MEKLELKEIVGYLPYRLKWQSKWFENPRIITVTPYEFSFMSSSLEKVKPLLKPIECITDKINPIQHHTFLEDLGYCLRDFDLFLFDLEKNRVGFDKIQKLYEWHFDIHNLINRGLAIDMNSL